MEQGQVGDTTGTPILGRHTEVERYARIAIEGARRHVPVIEDRKPLIPFVKWRVARLVPVSNPYKEDDSIVIERAIIKTMLFGNRINQTILYLLREYENRKLYMMRGYATLRDWALARLAGIATDDTIRRLCAATEKIVVKLDQQPMMIDGRQVDGLEMIANASATSLIKLSGLFEAEEDKREIIVQGLLTGSSDFNAIKSKVGWEPRIGKMRATIEYYTVDGEARCRITLDGTHEQGLFVERQLDAFIEKHFV